MKWLRRTVLWLYDFLAEDMVLLAGTALAIAVAAISAHAIKDAAGYILWAVVIVVITVSLWRTATTAAG
jgi:hypothetical protein